MRFEIIVFVVLGVALAAGFIANRWVRPFAKNESQGVKLELLISPLVTLTVLLLAFVLVQVFSGYKASRDASALEAGRIAYQFEIAGYYEDDFAQPTQASLICYARAVAATEWQTMGESPPRFAKEAGAWALLIDEELRRQRVVDNGQPYGTMLTADKERADGRRLRLSQARPAVPVEITALLLLTSTLAVAGIAAFTLPYVNRRTQFGALIVLAGVLGLLQVAIIDMDRKYDGFIKVPPDDFVLAADTLTPRYEARFPGAPLPCDVQGRAVAGQG